MEKYYKRRHSQHHHPRLTKYTSKYIKEQWKQSGKYSTTYNYKATLLISLGEYKVKLTTKTKGIATRGNKSHAVDLDAKTCTCPEFQDLEMPCRHALAISSASLSKEPEEFTSPYYGIDYYRACYASSFKLILPQHLEKCDTCYAPSFHKTLGRPKKSRIRTDSFRKRPRHCKSCGSLEHNRRRCDYSGPRGLQDLMTEEFHGFSPAESSSENGDHSEEDVDVIIEGAEQQNLQSQSKYDVVVPAMKMAIIPVRVLKESFKALMNLIYTLWV